MKNRLYLTWRDNFFFALGFIFGIISTLIWIQAYYPSAEPINHMLLAMKAMVDWLFRTESMTAISLFAAVVACYYAAKSASIAKVQFEAYKRDTEFAEIEEMTRALKEIEGTIFNIFEPNEVIANGKTLDFIPLSDYIRCSKNKLLDKLEIISNSVPYRIRAKLPKPKDIDNTISDIFLELKNSRGENFAVKSADDVEKIYGEITQKCWQHYDTDYKRAIPRFEELSSQEIE